MDDIWYIPSPVSQSPKSMNNGNVDPIYYSDQEGYNNNNRCFFNGSFFHMPSSPFMNPCYDQLDDLFHHDLLLQQQPSLILNMVESEINNNNNTNNKEQIPRKRCSKRDRHSKINTAQGPRDRRMRLSLNVAREFFDLQDKLCFDKASKTVEWLLIQARPAIKALSGTCSFSTVLGDKSASSTSECEVISGIDEEAPSIKANKPKSSSSVNNSKPKKAKTRLKIAFHPLARESREKARARARERTREKLKSKRRIDDQFNQFETGEESATQNPNLDIIAEPEAPSMIDDSLLIMAKWSPSIINHLYTSGFPQEQPISDFQQIMGGFQLLK